MDLLDYCTYNKVSGIYSIGNRVDSRIYIGSAIDLYRRLQHHRRALQLGNHTNQKLQRFVNKYTIYQLYIEIVELVEKDKLIRREQYWLDRLNSVKEGFNICPTAHSSKGRKATNATRKKMSETQKRIQKTLPRWLNNGNRKGITEKVNERIKRTQQEKRGKKMSLLDTNTGKILEFPSIKECARHFNTSQSHIQAVIKGKIKFFKLRYLSCFQLNSDN